MRVCFFLIILLLFITTCSSAILANATPVWLVQTVDSNLNARDNGYLSIAVDSNNHPHLTYHGVPGGVTYAYWDGSSWIIQNVTSKGQPYSVVLDADNKPHILYGGDGLSLATWTGTKWDTGFLNSGGFGSFAIDSYGNLHAVYTSLVNEQTHSLKYRRTVSGVWGDAQTVVTVTDSSTFWPFRTSLAVDSNNVTYIMYGVTDHGITIYSYDVKLAVYNNSGWSFQTVASKVNNYGNMVLDSKGYPHAIYQVNSPANSKNCSIVYASWDGSAWNTQTVASNITLSADFVGIQLGCLALDSRDYPHICYVAGQYMGQGSTLNLNYASWTGTAWNIQTVDNSSARRTSYLAMDADNNPHIVYEGKFRGTFLTDTMYATSNQPTPTPTPAVTATPNPTPPSKAALDPLWIAIPVVAIVVVAALAYMWKKKTTIKMQPQNEI
jgi:hypothetical protein